MSNSIPGKFSFPAAAPLAADKEEEHELSGGSITPVQLEHSLSFGDYYEFAELNSPDVKTEEADEKADEVTALMIQPCLNIGGSGDVNILGQGSSSSSTATATAARSSSQRRTEAIRARTARKLERKQYIEMVLKGTLPGSVKDDCVSPEGYEPRTSCRK